MKHPKPYQYFKVLKAVLKYLRINSNCMTTVIAKLSLNSIQLKLLSLALLNSSLFFAYFQCKFHAGSAKIFRICQGPQTNKINQCHHNIWCVSKLSSNVLSSTIKNFCRGYSVKSIEPRGSILLTQLPLQNIFFFW